MADWVWPKEKATSLQVAESVTNWFAAGDQITGSSEVGEGVANDPEAFGDPLTHALGVGRTNNHVGNCISPRSATEGDPEAVKLGQTSWRP